MIGAKINGRIVPIDTVPNTGDILEIITSSSSKGPSRDWIKIVKTSSARSKIKSFFKKEKRAENIIAGRSIVENDFKRFAPSATEQQRAETVERVCQRMGYMAADDMYNDLGYGGLTYSKVETKIRDEFIRSFGKNDEVMQGDDIAIDRIKLSTPKNVKSNGGVIVDGLDGCLIFRQLEDFFEHNIYLSFLVRVFPGFGVSSVKKNIHDSTNSLYHYLAG
jgi:GTP pyrophosphokinase